MFRQMPCKSVWPHMRNVYVITAFYMLLKKKVKNLIFFFFFKIPNGKWLAILHSMNYDVTKVYFIVTKYLVISNQRPCYLAHTSWRVKYTSSSLGWTTVVIEWHEFSLYSRNMKRRHFYIILYYGNRIRLFAIWRKNLQ